MYDIYYASSLKKLIYSSKSSIVPDIESITKKSSTSYPVSSIGDLKNGPTHNVSMPKSTK